MLDSKDLVNAIRQVSVESFKSLKPTNVLYGNVLSIDPLKISIEQKLILTKEYLLLTKNVADYKVNITVDHKTEGYTHTHEGDVYSYDTHNHAYKGVKEITIHNGLKTGDKVLLMQIEGGQKFIVLEKVGEAWA